MYIIISTFCSYVFRFFCRNTQLVYVFETKLSIFPRNVLRRFIYNKTKSTKRDDGSRRIDYMLKINTTTRTVL